VSPRFVCKPPVFLEGTRVADRGAFENLPVLARFTGRLSMHAGVHWYACVHRSCTGALQ